jgi:uncharacterized protein (UPF0335 family)
MIILQASAQKQLRQFVEQLERLEEEKKAIADDIRDKFAEAKALGFDVKTLRQVLRLRKKAQTDREEDQAVLDTYLHALGMLDGTPMGDYIEQRIERENLRDAAKAFDEVAGTNWADNVTMLDKVDAKFSAERRERNRGVGA